LREQKKTLKRTKSKGQELEGENGLTKKFLSSILINEVKIRKVTDKNQIYVLDDKTKKHPGKQDAHKVMVR
jgi:hypothetical protein